MGIFIIQPPNNPHRNYLKGGRVHLPHSAVSEEERHIGNGEIDCARGLGSPQFYLQFTSGTHP